MSVGRYVVTDAAGANVVGGPYLIDSAVAASFKTAEMVEDPTRKLMPETPTRRNLGGPVPITDQNRIALTQRADSALRANVAYLALPTPTAAQQTQQIDRLTRECSALIRLMLGALDSLDGA